jgi:hypothetical protein
MNETLKELFEACRNGDLTKVKKLITPENINSQDILGRKSTPLHFSSGKNRYFLQNKIHYFNSRIWSEGYCRISFKSKC